MGDPVLKGTLALLLHHVPLLKQAVRQKVHFQVLVQHILYIKLRSRVAYLPPNFLLACHKVCVLHEYAQHIHMHAAEDVTLLPGLPTFGREVGLLSNQYLISQGNP